MVHWNLAAIVGVPGVGKTSLCRRASESLGYNYVNYGELMLGLACERDLAHNLPELFKLNLNIQHEIWRAAALKIKDKSDVLVDLHGIDHFKSGYLLSLPIEILKPDIIIVIESSYDNILFRRQLDILKKERIIENIKSFNEHNNLLKVSMAVCSVILGCYLLILNNNNFDNSLNQLMKALDK
jgi:adenylate kinase